MLNRRGYEREVDQENDGAVKEFLDFLDGDGLGGNILKEGTVISGTIMHVDGDYAVIDVGLKTEGKVHLREFSHDRATALDMVLPGSQVDVYLEKMEGSLGEAVLSREKAKREEVWIALEKTFESAQPIEGVMFGRVKGGFTVDIQGIVAFLPGSQVDVRPLRNVMSLMHVKQLFRILKMDRKRGDIVVSRRILLEEERAEQRNEVFKNIGEGQVLEGVVKNITDYGAFVDLGGIDGLLHVTDISWARVNRPSDVLSLGQSVKVKVIKVNQDMQRISLGMRQLQDDPWAEIERKYQPGAKLKRLVTNVTDYGAFVGLEEGVEGLVHVSEMMWRKKSFSPSKLVAVSQEVEVMVLDVDRERRRISLGMKQCTDNPWIAFMQKYNVGDIIEGCVENIMDFGIFVGVEGGIDAVLRVGDLVDEDEKKAEEELKKYYKGQTIEAVVVELDAEKERIALSVKALKALREQKATSSDSNQKRKSESGERDKSARLKKGDVVTCLVSSIQDNGVGATIVGHDDLKGFIRKNDLSMSRFERHPDRFGVGDRVDALILSFDRSGVVYLSIKALEILDEKESIAQYGSVDSGASLGDILGVALDKARLRDNDGESNTKEEENSDSN